MEGSQTFLGKRDSSWGSVGGRNRSEEDGAGLGASGLGDGHAGLPVCPQSGTGAPEGRGGWGDHTRSPRVPAEQYLLFE